MSTDAQHDLLSFHQFVTTQLNLGRSELSPEEALDEWRLHNRSPEEYAADVQAIREALDDMESGDKGTPVDEFLQEFRNRHRLSGEK
jgi:hypothetical protein